MRTTDDAKVHRCGDCGAWCWAARPCTTCAIWDMREEAS